MYKKIASLILALTFILSACQAPAPKLTAKEVLNKVQEQSLAQDGMNFEITGTMNTDVESENTDSQAVDNLGMFKNIKFDASGAVKGLQADEFSTNMQFNVDMNGLAISASLYADNEGIIADYPMLGKKIVIKFDELIEYANSMAEEDKQIDPELFGKIFNDYKNIFMPKISKAMINNIDETSLSLIDEQVFTYKEEEIKSPALKINMNAEQYLKMIKGMIAELSTDEDIYNALVAYKIPEFPATFEDYQAEIKKITESEDFNKAFEQINSDDNNTTMEIIYGYNKDYLVTVAKILSNSTVNDSMTNTKVTVTQDMAMKASYDNISVTKPEVTAENSMGLQELIMTIFGGMN